MEYGGLGSDPLLQLSGTKTINVTYLAAPPPTVTTLAASNVTQVTATLNGSVNGNGGLTTVSFEYGLTTSYGTPVSATPSTTTGPAVTPVSANIAGLSLATVYHYRAIGVSSSGSVTGADMTFTTAGTITSGNDLAIGSTPGGASIGHWGSVRSGMVIAETGAIAYRGFLALGGTVDANNFQGIWKSNDGSSAGVYLLARTGDTAPDTGGALFDILPYNPVINNLSLSTFVGFLRVNTGSPTVATGPSGNDTGVWTELGGAGLHKVLRKGDTITGGTVTGIATSAWLATSDAGHTAFNVKLNASSSAMVRAVMSGGTPTVTTLVQQGDAAPAIGGGTSGTFDAMLGNTNDPRMDLNGNIAFLSLVVPSGSGIWYQPVSGSLGAVARSGQSTTSLGLAGDTFIGFERPTLSVGKIAFRAFLANNGQSVWRGNPAAPASLTVLAKTGDTALPGIPAGSQLWSIWSPYSNSSGQVAFRVTMLDAALAETRAIVTDTDGTLKVIAKVGDAAPGLAGETFTSFDHPVIGDGGQTAFVAATNSVPSHVGLWRQASGGGALVLVMKVGDSINTGNGAETVAEMIVPGSSSADRLNEVRSVTSTGRILVHLTYLTNDTGMLLTPY